MTVGFVHAVDVTQAELDAVVDRPVLSTGTASGPPTTGAHDLHELRIDDAGVLWFCLVAGTPGTWTDISSSGKRIGTPGSTTAQFAGITTAQDICTTVFTVVSRPVLVHAVCPVITGAGGQASNLLGNIVDQANVVKASSSGYVVNGGQGRLHTIEEITAPGDYTRKMQVSRSGTAGGTVTVNGAGVANIVSRIWAQEV